MEQVNFKSPLKNGELYEKLYTAQHEEFVVKSQEVNFMRMHKAFYNLRKIARA